MLKHDTDLQAVLDKGKAFLDKGDVAGYWGLMSRHSGFARFAGDVASGKGRIGPETTSTFAKVLRAAGPKLLTERFGRFLGIL